MEDDHDIGPVIDFDADLVRVRIGMAFGTIVGPYLLGVIHVASSVPDLSWQTLAHRYARVHESKRLRNRDCLAIIFAVAFSFKCRFWNCVFAMMASIKTRRSHGAGISER
jgi:hypothetical protein